MSNTTEVKSKHVSIDKKFYTIGEAATFSGLDPQTIRKFTDNGSIDCYRTPSGQRRINIKSLEEFCFHRNGHKYITAQLCDADDVKKNFIYTRVSAKKRMYELSRQLDLIQRDEYADYIVLNDVSSVFDFNRKGILTIIDACVNHNIGNIVIAHKDVLGKIGYELIDQLVSRAGGKIIIPQDIEYNISERETTEDLLSIISAYSTQQLRKRKTTTKTT